MLTDNIRPFYATDHGNCLCGPYMPLSVVRLGPDTLFPETGAPTNGYRSTQALRCFSHTHVSGTGGQGRYGNIGVLPFCGTLRPNRRVYAMTAETAEVGHYSVQLDDGGIRADLTSTPGVGVHRYTFPANREPNVLIDLAPCIGGRNAGGFVEVVSNDEVVGRGDYVGGWGHEKPYSIYFYARFETMPDQTLVFHDGHPRGERFATGRNLCCVSHVADAREVILKVGISFCSIANARTHYENQAAGKAFEEIAAAARRAWESICSRIVVAGGSTDERVLLYSSLYRLYCMPADLGTDHDFPYWRSGVRHYTDYYCFWDSCRCANSLFALIDPDLFADMMQCVLDIADHRGRLPDSWIAGEYGFSQGGSTAGVVFAEAAQKSIPGIDYEKALGHMRKDAEEASSDPERVGRYLEDYQELGYVSTRVGKACASRHVEYAYQDWCIARVAESLGDAETVARYDAEAEKVWNLFRDDYRSVAPRHPDGSWVSPFNPLEPTSWRSPEWGKAGTNRHFYEGSAEVWTFNIFQDFGELIERCGGDTAFCAKLDRVLDTDFWWKEITLHIPWLYTFAGNVDRTCERVRDALRLHYHTGRDGIEDDEDMGCQSAWYIFASLGFYPVIGQDFYLLSSPVFKRSELRLGSTDRTLRILAPGTSAANQYIEGVTLNGCELDRAWIRHAEIAGGGELVYKLGNRPSSFGSMRRPPRGSWRRSPCGS